MNAVDTNILIYAHRDDAPHHAIAKKFLTDLANSHQTWSIPWHCVHEFLCIVTHPRIFKPPTPLEKAIQQLQALFQCPHMELIGELEDYWIQLKDLIAKGRIVGPRIYDARIAATCIQNGVKTLWSADRDFSRIGGIEVKNPLL